MVSGCRPTGRAAAWRRSVSAALAALGLVLVVPAPARATWRDTVPPDWESAAWSAWQAAGQLTTQPALSSWGTGRLDLLARGSDGGLWHRWYDAGRWSGWEGLGAA